MSKDTNMFTYFKNHLERQLELKEVGITTYLSNTTFWSDQFNEMVSKIGKFQQIGKSKRKATNFLPKNPKDASPETLKDMERRIETYIQDKIEQLFILAKEEKKKIQIVEEEMKQRQKSLVEKGLNTFSPKLEELRKSYNNSIKSTVGKRNQVQIGLAFAENMSFHPTDLKDIENNNLEKKRKIDEPNITKEHQHNQWDSYLSFNDDFYLDCNLNRKNIISDLRITVEISNCWIRKRSEKVKRRKKSIKFTFC